MPAGIYLRNPAPSRGGRRISGPKRLAASLTLKRARAKLDDPSAPTTAATDLASPLLWTPRCHSRPQPQPARSCPQSIHYSPSIRSSQVMSNDFSTH